MSQFSFVVIAAVAVVIVPGVVNNALMIPAPVDLIRTAWDGAQPLGGETWILP